VRRRIRLEEGGGNARISPRTRNIFLRQPHPAQRLLNLAQYLQRSLGMSYLLVLHELARLLGNCVMVMRAEHAENGRTMAADPLDEYIHAVAKALALPVEEASKPAVRANLEVSLRLARLVDEFALPVETEPASVFAA
jgi:hypothetical protein